MIAASFSLCYQLCGVTCCVPVYLQCSQHFLPFTLWTICLFVLCCCWWWTKSIIPCLCSLTQELVCAIMLPALCQLCLNLLSISGVLDCSLLAHSNKTLSRDAAYLLLDSGARTGVSDDESILYSVCGSLAGALSSCPRCELARLVRDIRLTTSAQIAIYCNHLRGAGQREKGGSPSSRQMERGWRGLMKLLTAVVWSPGVTVTVWSAPGPSSVRASPPEPSRGVDTADGGPPPPPPPPPPGPGRYRQAGLMGRCGVAPATVERWWDVMKQGEISIMKTFFPNHAGRHYGPAPHPSQHHHSCLTHSQGHHEKKKRRRKS